MDPSGGTTGVLSSHEEKGRHRCFGWAVAAFV
jgi:hypothetical protein